MFEQGQQIIYAGNGICTIQDIITRPNAVSGEEQQVYVIQLASGLTSYVPVNSSIFMRALITPQHARQTIADFPTIPLRTFSSTNSKALADQYRAIIARHDPHEMLGLYKSLRNKAEQAIQAGKKPGSMDERFAESALDQVAEELAVVLTRSKEEIRTQLLPVACG